MYVEGKISQLPDEGRMLLLRDDVTNQGHYRHLHDQGFPEVPLSALIFEDFLSF